MIIPMLKNMITLHILYIIVVSLHTLYTCVFSYARREVDLQIDKNKKGSLLARGQREVISFLALWQHT